MAPLVALGSSVTVLLAGPLLSALLERRASLRAGLDGFVLTAVGGLALLFLLPAACFEGPLGGWALPIAAAGLLAPSIAERALAGRARAASRVALAAAMAALLVHCAVDGAALALMDPGHGHAHGHEAPAGSGRLDVALAVLVHRLPVGHDHDHDHDRDRG